jgi:hypothetical protein
LRARESAHPNESRPKIRRFAWMLGCAVLATGVFLSSAPGASVLAQDATAGSSDKGIEGDWVRTDSGGSGSFGGLSDKFKKAQLTPEGESMVANNQRPPTGPAYTENRVHKPGDPYIVVEKPCGAGGPFAGGGLGVNPDSNAIHIVQQKDEVVIAPERNGVRRIYTDGRRQADVSKWTPTGSGHSVGHYEGKVLVVDTVGLAPGPVPAGGYRTPETHLTERFEGSPDGQHLTIHYTYSDPKIYVTPHSYDYTFDRLPAGSYAFEDWCDASDPHERESITIPEQK